jgi:sortase A
MTSGRRSAVLAVGAMFNLVSVLALGFVVHIAVVSQVRYDRTQQTAWADFRAKLAKATAPVGQTGADGKPHPLGTTVAVLRIPAIGAREVVFEGTTSEVLQDGPGHRRDTPLPGQAGTSVLMGRRAAFGGPFRDIDLLNSGDTIEVVTGQGVHTYRVLGVRRTGDLAPPPLAAGCGRLTLVTADGQPFFPSDVLRVDADLSSPPQQAPAWVIGTRSLPPAEAAMGTDAAAWTPVVLWSQLLALASLGLTWARARWGRWQTWIVAVPVLGGIGLATAGELSRLLPNLI